MAAIGRALRRGGEAFTGLSNFLSSMMVSHLACGAALAILWRWFVEPIGAPGINYSQAIGISLIAELLTQRGMNYGLKENPQTDPIDHRMRAIIVASVFTVFLSMSLATVVSIGEDIIGPYRAQGLMP